MKMRKHNLKDMEETKNFYDDKLTESEICQLAGFLKIYDCGQIKYEFSIGCKLAVGNTQVRA